MICLWVNDNKLLANRRKIKRVAGEAAKWVKQLYGESRAYNQM